MLTTESMRKVTLILHQRRLANLIEQLGKNGLIQIIVKEEGGVENGGSGKELFEILRGLQEKINKILETDIDFEKKHDKNKISIEGQNIEEIVAYLKLEIEGLFNRWADLQKELNNLHLKLDSMKKTERLWADLLKNTEIDFTKTRNYTKILVRIGYLNWMNIELFTKSLQKFPHLFYYKKIGGEVALFLIASMRKYSNEIKKIEEEFHANMIENLEEVNLDTFNEVERRLREAKDYKQKLNSDLKELLTQNFIKLRAYTESIRNLVKILETQQKMNLTYHFITIEGWIPLSKLPNFKSFTKTLPSDIKILISDEVDINENPPTTVKRNKFTRIFGTLTGLYGVPRNREIDPTVLITISFPILFGFMFGDVGHGFMLLGGGLFFYFWKRKEQSSWKNLALIIAFCGISAIICGLLYGEFFGTHVFFGHHLEPLLFNPFSDMITALKLSVIIGAVMLSLAFSIEAVNFSLQGKKLDSVLVAIPKIFIFCGGVYIVFEYGFDIMTYFEGAIIIMVIPALIIVFGRGIVHLVTFRRAYPTETTGQLVGGGLLETWETLISFLSNIPSFCRIFALSLVHVGLTLAVIELSNISGFLAPVILIGGHIFVVLFEFLLVFIHNLRLHFNEFFGKFYHGDGRQFQPFVIENQFSTLIIKSV